MQKLHQSSDHFPKPAEIIDQFGSPSTFFIDGDQTRTYHFHLISKCMSLGKLFGYVSIPSLQRSDKFFSRNTVHIKESSL